MLTNTIWTTNSQSGELKLLPKQRLNWHVWHCVTMLCESLVFDLVKVDLFCLDASLDFTQIKIWFMMLRHRERYYKESDVNPWPIYQDIHDFAQIVWDPDIDSTSCWNGQLHSHSSEVFLSCTYHLLKFQLHHHSPTHPVSSAIHNSLIYHLVGCTIMMSTMLNGPCLLNHC